MQADLPSMVEPVREADLAAIARASFGANAEVVECAELPGGLFNTSYRVRVANPNVDSVLRIAPSDRDRMLEYERTMMLAEPRIYDLLREAGVPTPRVLALDGSHSVLTRDLLFMEYIEAVGMHDPSVPPEARHSLARDLGRCLARMHAIEGARFGRPMPDGSILGSERWAEVFAGMLEEVTARSEESGVIRPSDAAIIRRILDRDSAAFDAVTEPRLTHNDIWDPNILVCPNDGWHIAAIIDADRALFADREFEGALWSNDDPKFWEGYGRRLDPSPQAALRRRFYALYVYLWQAFAFKVQIWNPDWCESFRTKAMRVLGMMIEE